VTISSLTAEVVRRSMLVLGRELGDVAQAGEAGESGGGP